MGEWVSECSGFGLANRKRANVRPAPERNQHFLGGCEGRGICSKTRAKRRIVTLLILLQFKPLNFVFGALVRP